MRFELTDQVTPASYFQDRCNQPDSANLPYFLLGHSVQLIVLVPREVLETSRYYYFATASKAGLSTFQHQGIKKPSNHLRKEGL